MSYSVFFRRPLPVLGGLLLSSLLARAGSEPRWAVGDIPASLRENAHVVVRQQDEIITVKGAGRLLHTTHLVATVLDEQGERYGVALVFYDKLQQINYLRGAVYDAEGRQLRGLRAADTKDYSAYDGFSLYTDSRVRVGDLRQARYPYTVDFEYEVSTNNTLHFPTWQPQDHENLSVEHATLRVVTPAELPLRYREERLPAGAAVAKSQQGAQLVYAWQLQQLPAVEREPESPPLAEQVPTVYTAPTAFEVQGFAGALTSWQELGQWGFQLTQDRMTLTPETEAKVRELVRGVDDPRARARKVYAFLQGSTRYVSVQLGIGGYQPFPASTVASTGYGDCKALSNYCLALLKAAGVESYAAWIGAGQQRAAVRTSFPNDQFNHVILCVPLKQDTVWLECTSQTEAFGYLGSFTGGRHALLLTPQGGKLVRTPAYQGPDNRQYRRADVQIDELGHGRALVRTTSTGQQQDELSQIMHQLPADEQRKQAYKRLALSAVTIEQSSWQEDHRGTLPAVTERLTLALPSYASRTGRRLFLTPNLLNRLPPPAPRVGARQAALQLSTPFVDADTVRYKVPAGYKPESVPPPVQLRTAFGSYEAQTQLLPDGTVQYTRRLQMPAGRFEAKDYEAYEDFRQRISKADRSQLVLVHPES
jgi:transglutaminase-like putative cysteine protease